MKINKFLVKSSLILLISINIHNAINFFFHFGMARLMSVIDYGILATLYSIIYMMAVFMESIQLVIAKYSAEEKDKGKLKNVVVRAFKKSFKFSLILFLIYLAVAFPLAGLLDVEYYLLGLTGIMIFAAFLLPINRGIMQGRKQFKALGFNMVADSVVKISFALLFVVIGWSVFGAILGTIFGVTAAFLLSFLSVNDVFKAKESKGETKELYGYTKPAFIINLAILIFYGIDIVIAKIFLPELAAGHYAIASILAKTIFWGTQPISRAMFPLTAENKEKGKKSENVFLNSLALVSLAVVTALLLFYFFPDLIVKFFSGKTIPESVGILFFLGLATSLLSFANLILLYKLSLGKVKGCMYLFILVVIEIALLSFFSDNIFQFSIAFVTSAAIFLWGSIFLLEKT